MGWNDLIGHRLDRYDILEELGRGGSSRVYRAHDPEMDRDVAIKVIPNDADDRVTFVRRFEREAQVVRSLSHPNIVAVFSAGKTDDIVYLVMQCISGGTLRQRLGRPIPSAEAALYAAQMARALHHAHTRGIVHRDVKPSNMLVDGNDRYRLLLTDFGIAKIQGARGLTKSGTTIGTPEYMSPEQAEGREIDQRSDIYALGCVLYEMLAGRPPFVGSTPVSVLYQQVHSRPAYIRGFNPEVPREMARILEVSLAKRPEDRFGTGDAFAEALAPFYVGLGVEMPWLAMPSSRPPQIGSGPLASRPLFSEPLTPPNGSAHQGMPGADQAQPVRFPPVGVPLSSGLDDIFPETPVTPVTPVPNTDPLPGWLQAAGGVPPPAHPVGSAETPPEASAQEQMPPRVQRAPRQTIPLPSFRLPAKKTAPLDLPLTPDGQLDLEALLAEHERLREEHQRLRATTEQAGLYPPTGIPLGQPQAPSPPPAQTPPWAGGRAAPSTPDADWNPAGAPSFGPSAGNGYDQADTSGAPPSVPTEAGEGGRRRGTDRPGARQPLPIWRPEPEPEPVPAPVRRGRAARQGGSPRVRQGGSRRVQRVRRSWLAASAVAALVCLSLAAWIVVNASGLAVTTPRHSTTPVAHTQPTHTATAAPTATATATAPPTATPQVTPTESPQQRLDAQAASSFRAVTLGRFVDGSCSSGNNVTQFGQGQTIYFNFCTSGSAVSGPLTVAIRQNGSVVYNLGFRQYLSPGASYYCYSSYGFSPGTYDALITVQVNGQPATARDIQFTIG